MYVYLHVHSDGSRFLTLLQRLNTEGWRVVAGRVHYTPKKCGRTLNLDGEVVGADGLRYLLDYTWFRSRVLNDTGKSYKRGDCSGRFSSLRKSSTKFQRGFNYNNCAGILIAWIQYSGQVTLETLPKP